MPEERVLGPGAQGDIEAPEVGLDIPIPVVVEGVPVDPTPPAPAAPADEAV